MLSDFEKEIERIASQFSVKYFPESPERCHRCYFAIKQALSEAEPLIRKDEQEKIR